MEAAAAAGAAGSPKRETGLQAKISAAQSTLAIVVVTLVCLLAFISRLFAVIRFEAIIHEFDPWFNYRATAEAVNQGYYNFHNWFDKKSWYPLGRIVGGTVYPGLMVTSGLIHNVLHALNVGVHIRDVCVFLAPLFSGLTAVSAYLLTSELHSKGAGLLAAAFLGIAPGYISRSVAGSYDNEGIAIFALLFTFWLWIKAVKSGSVYFGGLTALSYFYMVSAWGGYVFIINLIPLHVFVLLLMNRFSPRLYTSYCTFYMLGTLLSMQIPFVGFQPLRTSEHMAAAGVFALLQVFAFRAFLLAHTSAQQGARLFKALVVVAAGLVFLAVVGLTWAGVVAPWTGRFYSLWDTGYAKIHIPIIASVSEHQPTTWTSFFFDLHVLVAVFPAGVFFCLRKLTDENVFIILYSVFAVYFAGVMVRLMLTLTPVVCITAAIAFSNTITTYLGGPTLADGEAGPADDGNKKASSAARKRAAAAAASSSSGDAGDSSSSSSSSSAAAAAEDDSTLGSVPLESSVMVVGFVSVLFILFVVHCTWVTSNAYSSPSIVLASRNPDGSRLILDDFREAYHWLRHNTPEDARVMSWWDYGYQITGMADRTVLVDNNTWNNTHISLVGKAMASNETEAYKIMRALDVDYVLVIFGGVIGYSGDDINKFLWMVRIAEGEHPGEVREADFFSATGEYKIDSTASETMKNSLMYKMSYYRFGEIQLDYRSPAGFDRVRNAEVGVKDIKLRHIEEAYTTEHWMVRVYRVLPEDNETPSSQERRRAVDSGKPKRKPKRGKGERGFVRNKRKRRMRFKKPNDA